MHNAPTHIPSTWTRVAGIHIGSGKFSALWGAHDRVRHTVRIYDEYSVPMGALPVHAEAMTVRGKWIPALIDLDHGGAAERPGRVAMAHRLMDLGVNFANDLSWDPEVAASDILTRAATGRLEFGPTLSALPNEYALYRRDEEGGLPEGFGLIRALGLVVGPGLAVAMSETVAASEREGYELVNPTRNPSTGY